MRKFSKMIFILGICFLHIFFASCAGTESKNLGIVVAGNPPSSADSRIIMGRVIFGKDSHEDDNIEGEIIEKESNTGLSLSPGTRKLAFSFNAEEDEILDQNTNADCQDMSVEFFDTKDKTIVQKLSADCSFSQDLDIGKAWGINFIRGETVIQTLFKNGELLHRINVYFHELGLNGSNEVINLGSVAIYQGSAYPEFEPSLFIDSDGDLVVDYFDSDDDNDDFTDLEEYQNDCDEDGFIDDFDLDFEPCRGL